MHSAHAQPRPSRLLQVQLQVVSPRPFSRKLRACGSRMRIRERRRLLHARDFLEKGRLRGKGVMFCLLLLGLFLSPVEVQTQQATFPYVSFVGQTLANNSYLDLALVGSESLLCHTDLRTCCTSQEGAHSGDWHAPDAITVPLRGDMYESHGA